MLASATVAAANLRENPLKKIAVVVALVALGCTSEKAGPEPEGTRRVVVATFTGEIDRVAGTFTIRTEPTAAGRALGMASLTVDADVTVANVAGSQWNNASGHCTAVGQSSGGEVTVKSNLATDRLDNVWAVIDTMSTTGTESCNSDTTPVPLGMTTNLGVWHYGDLLPGATSTAKPWAFTFSSGVISSFSGHIEAAIVEFRANVAPNVVVATPSSTVMTGTADRAIFLDGAGQKVSFVNSSGVLGQSGVLSGAPNGVAVNAAGTEAWVAIFDSPSKRVRVTIPGGVVTEFNAFPAPLYIAVDPVDGSRVWSNNGSWPVVTWFNPVSETASSVNLPPGATPGAMVAVNRSGTCLLYVEDSIIGDVYRVNCTTDTLEAPVIALAGCSSVAGLIAGPGGTAWYVGPPSVGGAYACRIEDSIASPQFFIPFVGAEVLGFAYGPDGNLWATINDITTGDIVDLVRLWVATPTGYGSMTSYGGIGTTLPAGLASGAGSVWVVLQDGTAYQVTP